MQSTTQVCKTCSIEKPITDYHHPKGKANPLRTCKECQYAKNREWRAANKDKVRASQAAWRAANQDKTRAYSAAWRAANLDKARAKSTAYYAANLDKMRAYSRDYKAAWRAANKDKVKAQERLRTYGLTEEAYEALLKRSGNMCEICGTPFEEGRGPKAPHVDHCHDSGAVRGLLCRKCNGGLGMLQDSPFVLESAIVYLAKAKMAVAA